MRHINVSFLYTKKQQQIIITLSVIIIFAVKNVMIVLYSYKEES